MHRGVEWLVDATGCPGEVLRSLPALQALFGRIIEELELHPVGQPLWHAFPGEAGITGLVMLSESHLACHTFPEEGYCALSLFTCRERPEWPWPDRMAELLRARAVTVRSVTRGEPGG